MENSCFSEGAGQMKNIYDVIRQKEEDLVRLQNEIEALKIVIPLIVVEQPERLERAEDPRSIPQPTGADVPLFSSIRRESHFWQRDK